MGQVILTDGRPVPIPEDPGLNVAISPAVTLDADDLVTGVCHADVVNVTVDVTDDRAA